MQYRLYTDGACQPNPGHGGWAFIICLETDGVVAADSIQSGYEPQTTNNRMEIRAVIEGLKFFIQKFPKHYSLLLLSDSKYLLQGMEVWMFDWIKRGWIKKDKKAVINTDLWKEVYNLVSKVQINYHYIKGHSGDSYNEECDKLAVKEIQLRK